ncbi:uncharacterized protein LOC122813330 [Protopterus annectens]|uniref:uncharacterized protein LOC122813330 n=1 Tax=Protopterus annectens TaxID=7888 RepID=UPI001CFA1B1F|nr:uncharacterized protein LOC122813330 [Protopterus annectens]
MTQRILTAFDTLDFYSKKIFGNHRKKRQLGDIPFKISLCTPVSSDGESEVSLPRCTILPPSLHSSKEDRPFTPRLTRYENPEFTVESAVPRHSCSKQLIRPFSAFEKSSGLKENVWAAADAKLSAAQKSKKLLASPRCRSASSRRTKWITEVEKVSHFIPSWEENSRAHIGAALEYSDSSHWCTFTDASIRRNAFADGKEDECITDKVVEKEEVQHLQSGKKIHVGRNDQQQKTPNSKNGKKESTLSGETAARSEEVQDLKEDYSISTLKSKDNPKLVPLSIEEQLERPDIKILIPKTQKTEYSSLALSETYPVTFYDDNSKHKLLLKPWTESYQHLKQSSNCLERTIRQETERYATRSVLEDDTSSNTKYVVENTHKEYVREFNKNKTQKRKSPGKQKMSIHVLFADGSRQPLQLEEFRNKSVNKSADSTFENAIPVNKIFLRALSSYRIKSTGFPDNRPATTGINLSVGADYDTFSNGMRSKRAMSKARHHTGCHITLPSSSTHQVQKNISEQDSQRNYIPIAKPIKLQESEKSLYSNKNYTTLCNTTENQVLVCQKQDDSVILNPENISLLEVQERRTPDTSAHLSDKSPSNTNIHTHLSESDEVADKYSLHLTSLSVKDGPSSSFAETSSQPSSPLSELQSKVLESETSYRNDWPNEVSCLQNPAPAFTPSHENVRPVINIPTASFDPLSFADIEE